MKIGFIGDAQSIHIQRWVNWFADRGHEVHLISFKSCTNLKNIKLHVIKTNRYGYFNPLNYLRVRKILREINPDIIHAHYVAEGGILGATSGFNPFIVSAWGSDIAVYPDKSILHKKIVKYVLKKADAIQVQDTLSAKRVNSLGASLERINIIPWGINIELFKPLDIKKKYDVMNLHGNSFIPHDVATFIRALPIVKKAFPNIKFFLLGSKDSSYDLAKKLGVLGNITFGGFVKHSSLPSYLSQSKIFVDCFYPHHNHGGHTYGIALLEAMACGIPTVVSDRPTINQLKDKNKWYYGKTFRGGDPSDLATRIVELLNSNEERNRISQKNRGIVEEKFDWNKNIAEIENMILNTI